MATLLSTLGREGTHSQARGTRKLCDFPAKAGISEVA